MSESSRSKESVLHQSTCTPVSAHRYSSCRRRVVGFVTDDPDIGPVSRHWSTPGSTRATPGGSPGGHPSPRLDSAEGSPGRSLERTGKKDTSGQRHGVGTRLRQVPRTSLCDISVSTLLGVSAAAVRLVRPRASGVSCRDNGGGRLRAHGACPLFRIFRRWRAPDN